MKALFEYVCKIFSKWWLVLGAIAGAIGNIDTLTPYKITILSQVVSSGIALFCLLLAGYLVWGDERKKRIAAEKKNVDFVDYEITANLRKVILDEECIYQIASEKTLEIQKLLGEAIAERNARTDSSKNSEISFLAAKLLGEEDYIKNLDSYICKLQLCHEEATNLVKKYKDLFSLEFAHLYETSFTVTNTGNLYDEKIKLIVNFGEGQRVFSFSDIADLLPQEIKLPEKPILGRQLNFQSNGFVSSFNISKELYTNLSTAHCFYQDIKILPSSISITLREIRAGSSCDMLGGKLFLNLKDHNNIVFHLNSINTRCEIEKNILLKESESIMLQDSLYSEDSEWI